MALLRILAFLSLSSCIVVLASDCNSDPNVNFTCPDKGGFYCELAASLSGPIIFRCIDGCPIPGNCNDDLTCYPAGTGGEDKQGALCYQDSPTAGNAQCTYNCVNVTEVDGSVFYPLGCVSSALTTISRPADFCANGTTLALPSGIIQTASTAATATSPITSPVTTTSLGTSPSPASSLSTSPSPTGTASKSDGNLRRPHTPELIVLFGLLMLY